MNAREKTKVVAPKPALPDQHGMSPVADRDYEI